MPPFWLKLPAMFSVPIELPGASMAPLETRPPIVPLPPSVLLLSSVTVLARLPFTTRPLPVTVVAPV